MSARSACNSRLLPQPSTTGHARKNWARKFRAIGSYRTFAIEMGCPLGVQHAAADLIALHGFGQRLKIAFAKARIAHALNDLEKDRPDQRGGEDLQQQTAVL